MEPHLHFPSVHSLNVREIVTIFLVKCLCMWPTVDATCHTAICVRLALLISTLQMCRRNGDCHAKLQMCCRQHSNWKQNSKYLTTNSSVLLIHFSMDPQTTDPQSNKWWRRMAAFPMWRSFPIFLALPFLPSSSYPFPFLFILDIDFYRHLIWRHILLWFSIYAVLLTFLIPSLPWCSMSC